MGAISSILLRSTVEFAREPGSTRPKDEGPSYRERIGLEWLEVWQGCERRLNSWRVPPRWSVQDWREEMRAEGIAAAFMALERFRPELNVPLKVYLRMRIMGQVLARYRKEWTYGLRQSGLGWSCRQVAEAPSSSGLLGVDEGAQASDDMLEVISRLNAQDEWLIRQIFWGNRTEAEIGRSLGLTQQAVNKRKRSIMRMLRVMIESDRN